MVIYGIRSAHLKTVNSSHLTCPHCKASGTITFSIYRKHIHVFFIPVFPIVKVGYSSCGNCGEIVEAKNMTYDVKQAYNEIKAQSKGPIWQFTGLVLIGALFIMTIINVENQKELDQQYLAQPLAGDKYRFVTEMKWYSIMQVVDIVGDSADISINNYEVESRSALYKIDIKENYPNEYFRYSIDEIRDMYEEGTIYEINRPHTQ